MVIVMKIIFFILYGILCLSFLVAAFEVIYRFQIIDTYAVELRTNNSQKDLINSDSRPTLLVMGDAFSVGNMSYPSIMSARLPGYRVINGAVSGTGIIDAAIIAPKRFKEFSPSIFIYQVYVGKDLFEITRPVNWNTISVSRNVYWLTSNYLRSLGFLNDRLGKQVSHIREIMSGRNRNVREAGADQPALYKADSFSVDRYSGRTKLKLRADPWLLDKQIMVRAEREKDFKVFLMKLKELVSYGKADQSKTYILVIPHSCQINNRYLDNTKQLGARFSSEREILKNDYPFIKKLRLAVAGEPGVSVLDPLEYLRKQEAAGELMYLQNDEHLSPAGQKAIADFILNESGIN
jgi:hypothetical protein